MSDELVLELDGVTKVYGEQPPVAALRGVFREDAATRDEFLRLAHQRR